MDDREKILDKIKKLLALSGSSNPNEAATAAAHAQRLMDKYKIEQTMLEAAAEVVEEDVRDWNDPLDGVPHKSFITWKARLGLVIGKHNGVFIWKNGGAIMLVGKASDVQATRYLYAYCAREIDRLTKEHCAGEGKSYANNFRLGCIDTIAAKLKEERDALRKEIRQQSTGTALVRVNEALAKIDKTYSLAEVFATQKFKLRTGTAHASTYNKSARAHGQQVGKSINLSQGKGLGSGNKGLLK